MNITIHDLRKEYAKGVVALHGVNLMIEAGMFGLLGPNGAGKTTLMRIIATLLRPTWGHVRVGEWDVTHPGDKWRIRENLGYLPQELSLYGDLSARQFLELMADLKLVQPQTRARQISDALEMTGLTDVAGRALKTYSGGMKRRVGIAQALLGNPKVLIVDEPTAGLDPQERVRFRNLLVELAGDRIVLLSTHIVEDVAQTCTRAGVLHKGRLLFAGPVAELARRATGCVWEFEADGYAPAPTHVLVASVRTPSGLKYRVLAPERPAPDARSVEPTLEDSYLWLIRQGERAG